MASNILCDPCQLQDKQNKASEWCPDCEENLCAVCSTHHKFSKATKNHNLVKTSVMSEIPVHVKSEEVCPRHNQLQVEYFCTSHDDICCRACLADKHRTCSDIVVIDIACKNTQLSLLDDAKGETNHIIKTLELVKKEIGRSCSDIKQTSQEIVKEIADAKNEAVKRLEETEKVLVNELYKKAKEFNREAQYKSDKIHDLLETSTEKLKQIEFVEKHGNEKQAFFLAHKFKTFLTEIESPLAEVTSINAVTLKFAKSQATTSDVLLGTISRSEHIKQITTYSPVKQKQAQFTVESNKLLTSFQSNSQFRISCKSPFILGMIATDDGKLLLCNHRDLRNGGGVYVYQQTGQYITIIPLHYPFDIAYIESMDQFAVSLSSSKSIQFISRKSMDCLNITKLNCQEDVYGIAANETQIYISTDTRVIVMNIDNLPEETKFNAFQHNFPQYVQTTTKEVLVSRHSGISTLDKSKEYSFSGGGARKIIIDRNGYIYVAFCTNPSYIQRLTPDLKPDIKITIDGGVNTRAICFNKDCSKLFYANADEDLIVTMSCS